jgi:guanyl-specific ribonuclease Sa
VAIALGLLAVALAVAGVLALRSASFPISSPDSGTSSQGVSDAPSGQRGGVPATAWQTLESIDAGRWPPVDAPGTKGGELWGNRTGSLPAVTAAGASISYREWDVNRRKPGRGRDAQRIVTGSDGSAWYTGDHYRTFTRMR